MVAPAPVVIEHAGIFRDLFENQCQFRHFQHYLTGLIVLPNKSMANIARCILESADKTNLSRFLSEAPWREDAVNRHRIQFMGRKQQRYVNSHRVCQVIVYKRIKKFRTSPIQGFILSYSGNSCFV